MTLIITPAIFWHPWLQMERDALGAQMHHISYQFTSPEYKQLVWVGQLKSNTIKFRY